MTRAPRERTATAVAAFLSALVVLLAIGRVSTAGFTAHSDTGSGWAAGTVQVSDDDAGTALFNTSSEGLLDGGQTLTRCVAVTYTGTLTAGIAVRLHAVATGALAPYLTLTVEEGTGGGAGTCTGFTASSTLYTGTVEGFATTHSTFATGTANWTVTATPQSRTYRFTTTVQNVPAAQSTAATATFTWEAGQYQFTPATLANKALWLRAKDLPAGPAPAWPDKASDNTFTSVGSSVPAVVNGATPNGGKAVRFTTTTPNVNAYRGHVPLSRYGAAASSEQTGAETPGALDGNPSTIWASANPTFPTPTYAGAWFALNVRPGSTITGYTLTGWRAGWSPTAWTVEASHDYAAWTTIDTRTGVTWPTLAAQTFTLATPSQYRHYRLKFTAVDGGPIVALTEIALNGSQPSTSAAETWIVMRAKTGGGARMGLWATGNNFWQSVPYDNGIYENFGTPTQGPVAPFAVAKSLYDWRIYRVASNGTAWMVDLDGERVRTVNANYTNWGTALWTIGSSRNVYGYNGDIAEVLVRDTVSTPQEAANLIGYFNAEHGLSVPTS